MRISEKFFRDKVTKIFTEKAAVIDVGGGLRIDKTKGNKYEPTHEWILPLAEAVDYKVLDPVPDYGPDIVGDVQQLPFEDNSQDAIVCVGVLNCVEDPVQAVKEIHRTLKPGGYALIYFSFLRFYSPLEGYYKDYWRFTEDAVDLMMAPFSAFEVCRVRGAIETLANLTPARHSLLANRLARLADKVLHKDTSKQTSGYHVFAIK